MQIVNKKQPHIFTNNQGANQQVHNLNQQNNQQNKLNPNQLQITNQMNSFIRESTRKSFVAQQISSKDLQKILDQPLDNNSMRLKQGETVDNRVYIKKQGYLEIQETEAKCWSFNFCCKGEPLKKCRLDQNILQIQDSSSSRFVCFDTVTVKLTKGSDFFIIGFESRSEKNLHFKAKSQAQAQQWIEAIQNSIANSYGSQKKLAKILNDPQFLSRRYIIQSEFIKQCNSGDIILFQDNHTFAKVQRAFTMSQYDHVGIILKNRKDEVVLLESNSNSGVAFTFWNQLIRYKWYDSIPRITWRKLNINRNNNSLNIMQEFIVNNLHKQYGLNFEKLFKFKSKINKTQKEQKQRTYFCSELVAAFYKKLGLVDLEKATTQYWPVTFSDAGSIKIMNGTLEPERIIVFQPQLLQRLQRR